MRLKIWDLLSSLLKSSFGKNLLVLVSATAVAQLINLGFNILLTHLYKPAQFGVLALFTSFLGILSIFSAGKFDVALVVAKSREKASRLLSLCFWIALSFSFLVLILILINRISGIHLYGESEVYSWLGWLPISLFMLTMTQVLWMWNVREKNFGQISWIRIVEAAMNGAGAFVFFSLGTIGLLYGSLVSQFCSVLFLAVFLVRKEHLTDFRHPISALRETFQEFSEFPKVNILQGVMDIYQLSVIILTSSHYMGDVITGYYGQCMRVLQVPMRLVILPVSHVFFAEASELYRAGGDLYSLVKKTLFRTALFAFPIPLILGIAGPLIFRIVFGAEWEEAGVYARILSLWIFFDLVRAPIAQVASITGKQKLLLIGSFLGNVILSLILFFGIAFKADARIIFTAVSVSQSLVVIFLIFLLLRVSASVSKVNPRARETEQNPGI